MLRALLVAVAIALSSAGTALAAYTSPSLRVTDDRSAVTIRYTVSATDDPTAKLTFYVPTGYSASLAAPAGTTLGTVTAQGTAADLGGALLPLTGTVQARAADGTLPLPGTTQVPLAAAATQCTGTPTHTAYWVLILQAAGQTLELPVFVDSPAAGTGASAFATSSIQACLPPPDVPTGTPGRATFGFKLTQVDFKVNRVFTSAGSGQPRWRVLATPYVPAQGRANAAGSVEAQSVIPFPRTLSLRKPTLKTAKGTATLTLGGTAQLPDRGRSAPALPRQDGRRSDPVGDAGEVGHELPRHAADQADGQAPDRLPAGQGERRRRHGHVHADVRRPVRRRHARGCRRAQRHRSAS